MSNPFPHKCLLTATTGWQKSAVALASVFSAINDSRNEIFLMSSVTRLTQGRTEEPESPFADIFFCMLRSLRRVFLKCSRSIIKWLWRQSVSSCSCSLSRPTPDPNSTKQDEVSSLNNSSRRMCAKRDACCAMCLPWVGLAASSGPGGGAAPCDKSTTASLPSVIPSNSYGGFVLRHKIVRALFNCVNHVFT